MLLLQIEDEWKEAQKSETHLVSEELSRSREAVGSSLEAGGDLGGEFENSEGQGASKGFSVAAVESCKGS